MSQSRPSTFDSMTIKRGEIYFVNLNPVQGREQAGQTSGWQIKRAGPRAS
jgi:mRNA interferase MazF